MLKNPKKTIAGTHVKVVYTSENLLNVIHQIVYCLFWGKKFTKKSNIQVYNKVIHSVRLKNKIKAIFMNSENTKRSDPHRLIPNLADKET